MNFFEQKKNQHPKIDQEALQLNVDSIISQKTFKWNILKIFEKKKRKKSKFDWRSKEKTKQTPLTLF